MEGKSPRDIEHGSPPDDAGHRGAFTLPEDVMILDNEADARCAPDRHESGEERVSLKKRLERKRREPNPTLSADSIVSSEPARAPTERQKLPAPGRDKDSEGS
jgi:hypothetical protein